MSNFDRIFNIAVSHEGGSTANPAEPGWARRLCRLPYEVLDADQRDR